MSLVLMDDEAAAAAYEETRLANMKANAALLDSLGLAKPAKAPSKRPSRKRQWSEGEDAAGPRRSLRATRGTRRDGEPRAESAAAKMTTTKASSSSLPLSSSSPSPEAPSYPDFSDDASSYEATRLANIRANAELLLSLGLTGFDDGSKAALEDRVAGKKLSDDEKYAPRHTLLAEKQRQTKAANRTALPSRRSARFAEARAKESNKGDAAVAGSSSSPSSAGSPQPSSSKARRIVLTPSSASFYGRARRASSSAHSATPSLQSSGSSSSSSSSMSPSPSSSPLTPSPTKSKRAGHTVSAWTSPNASSWSAGSLSPSRYSGRERRQANFWPSYVVPLGEGKERGVDRGVETAVGGTGEGEVEDATASFVASCRIYDEQRRAKSPPVLEGEDTMWIEMDLPEAGQEWWREGHGEQSAWYGRRFLPRLAAK